MSQLWPKWYKPRRRPVDEIIAFVGREYDMTREMLLHDQRRDAVNARSIIAQILKRRGLSSTVTGRILGGRDHTTAIHAWKTWPTRLQYNPEMQDIFERTVLWAGDGA